MPLLDQIGRQVFTGENFCRSLFCPLNYKNNRKILGKNVHGFYARKCSLSMAKIVVKNNIKIGMKIGCAESFLPTAFYLINYHSSNLCHL